MKFKFKLSGLSIILITLQVVFLTLQLSGVIQWEWWKVFLPLIVIGGIFVLDIVLATILYIIWRRHRNNGRW